MIVFPDITSPVALVYNSFKEFAIIVGYPGLFLVSFLGNATILVPFPYVGVPFFMGVNPFNPWITGIIGGLGAMLGEMTGYAVGYGGKRYLDDEQVNDFHEFIVQHPKATMLVVWFLAVTPIPDDMFIVPLGAARYSWWRVFVPGFIGKSIFLACIAWAGRFGMTWVETLFGGAQTFVSKSIEVFAILLVVIAIYLVVQINWSELTKKKLLDE